MEAAPDQVVAHALPRARRRDEERASARQCGDLQRPHDAQARRQDHRAALRGRSATIPATSRSGCRRAASCMRASSAISTGIPTSGPTTATAPPGACCASSTSFSALKPRVMIPAHGPLGDVKDLHALTDYLLLARKKVLHHDAAGPAARGHRQAVPHERVQGLGPRVPLRLDRRDAVSRAARAGAADRASWSSSGSPARSCRSGRRAGG